VLDMQLVSSVIIKYLQDDGSLGNYEKQCRNNVRENIMMLVDPVLTKV